ncbi:MAG: DUF5722 domain-containing protein [Chthoniobacteraceae bacterium]
MSSLFHPALRLGIILAGVALTAISAFGSPSLSIAATETELLVTVDGVDGSEVEIVELAAQTQPESGALPKVVWKDAARREVAIPRFDGARDRLYTPLALRIPGAAELATPPQWVTDFSRLPLRKPPFLRPKTKKGFNSVVDVKDIVEIGAGHASLNIDLRPLLDPKSPEPEYFTMVDGRKIGMRTDRVRSLDHQIKEMTDAGISVTAILLSYARDGQQGDPFLHPATDLKQTPTGVVAFNTATAEGLLLYRAALQFLFERYTRADAQYGLLSGAIVGNEVQSHWMWYNLGDAEPAMVVREYHTALRMADLISRSICTGFKVYVSMDHHWSMSAAPGRPKRGMRGDHLLEDLNTLARSQGNFPWALAHHPYPSNLFDARFWNNRDAFFRIDTPKITFKNLEVLPAFLRQERFLYEGQPRALALTEQGFHRPKGAKGEERQAAAVALGYRKLDLIPEIEFFLMHRHQDHPHEGGLNLGVLDHEKRRTKAWYVYQGIDTERAPELVEAARVFAGLDDLALLNSQPVEMTPRETTNTEDKSIYNFVARFEDAEVVDTADYRPGDTVKAAGWLVPALYMHPPGGAKKEGRATFPVTLPPVKAGEKLTFEFGTAIEAPSRDGVGFRVLVDGKPVFHHDQKTQTYEPQTVDLTAFAGKKVTIALVVDALRNSNHDLASWAEPAIHVR